MRCSRRSRAGLTSCPGPRARTPRNSSARETQLPAGGAAGSIVATFRANKYQWEHGCYLIPGNCGSSPSRRAAPVKARPIIGRGDHRGHGPVGHGSHVGGRRAGGAAYENGPAATMSFLMESPWGTKKSLPRKLQGDSRKAVARPPHGKTIRRWSGRWTGRPRSSSRLVSRTRCSVLHDALQSRDPLLRTMGAPDQQCTTPRRDAALRIAGIHNGADPGLIRRRHQPALAPLRLDRDSVGVAEPGVVG